MNVGMLWLDADDKRPLDEKVLRAADYYKEKYGRMPDLCLVNAKALEADKTVGEIMVQPAKLVLPSHLWLGMRAGQALD